MDIIKKITKRNLVLNKKRSIFTVIGITLAVALLVSVSTIAASFKNSTVEFKKYLNGDYHFAFVPLTKEDVESLKLNKKIESLYTIGYQGFAVLEGVKEESKPYATILTTDGTGVDKFPMHLLEGRWPENENEIVITEHLERVGRLKLQIGDELELEVGRRVDNDGNYLGVYDRYYGDNEKIVETGKRKYTVVGIMSRNGGVIEPSRSAGYACLTYSQDPGDEIMVFTRYTKQGLADRRRVTAGILGVDVNELDEYYGVNSPLNVFYNDEVVLSENIDLQNNNTKMMLIIVAVAFFIIIFTSVYCIKNSFEISISEKKRQYGMLSGIGATKKQLRKSVFYEGFYLGMIGIPLGCVIGILFSYLLISVSDKMFLNYFEYNLSLKISIPAIIIAYCLGIITVYLSALCGAKRALKVSPVSAIRNENEIIINRKKVKATSLINKIWGIGGVIAYKNIKRNKSKYRTTIVSVVVCTVAFISISYFVKLAVNMADFIIKDRGYSIYVNCRGVSANDKTVADIISMSDGECIAYDSFQARSYGVQYSDEYLEILPELADEEYPCGILVVGIRDELFEEYIKNAGIEVPDRGNAVLIPKATITYWSMEDDKEHTAVLDVIKCKPGSELGVTYSCDTDDIQPTPSEDGIIYDATEKTTNITVSAISDKRPFFGNHSREQKDVLLVMRYSDYEKFGGSSTVEIYVDSPKPDELQDKIEEYVKEKTLDINCYNYAPEVRERKSEITLISIFVYSFIAVIAVIGITNIINTISTGTELRAREFAALKSVGMTSREFNRMRRLESMFISFITLIIGIPFGYLVSFVIYLKEKDLSKNLVGAFEPPVLAVLLNIVVVIVLLYVIMKISIKKINRRNIIDTIKNENI